MVCFIHYILIMFSPSPDSSQIIPFFLPTQLYSSPSQNNNNNKNSKIKTSTQKTNKTKTAKTKLKYMCTHTNK